MTSGLRYNDKVVIVTGGCSGIGKGVVETFVENGGNVMVFDINDKVGNCLNVQGPGKVLYRHCDVTKEDEIQKCIEETIKEFGKIDCVVNDVGYFPGGHTIDEVTSDLFRRVLDVNLVSMFTMCKYALPFVRQTKGSIINMSSISGVIGTAASFTYSAAKGGVISFTKALAIDESKHGVRVNAIAPGAVSTPMLNDVLKQSGDPEGTLRIAKGYNHLKRIADPREIGQACLFLAVDATYTTGEVLMCSAGNEIGCGVK